MSNEEQALLRGKIDALLQSEEVVQEVLASVLVAGLRNGLLIHDIVIGVISLPRFLLMLSGNTSFFLALEEMSALPQAHRVRRP
jgi:hypothetical protein